MILSVQEYNKYEKKAINQLPNRVIEAFQPTEFYNTGYPTRIETDEELWKYIDVMQIKRYENNVINGLGGLSEDEFEIYRRLTKNICEFSKKYFSKSFVARNSISRSFIVFRALRQIYNEYTPTVYEIGPGCGYLGALVNQQGWPYYAMDNTQAFYLYQNRLWNYLSNNRVCEAIEPSSNYTPNDIVHIPWWNFYLDEKPIKIDVITCNHMLIEMNPIALKYTVKKMHELLSHDNVNESQCPKIVLFEGWGGGTTNTIPIAFKQFMDSGFRLIYHDRYTDKSDAFITIFALENTSLANTHFSLPHPIINALKYRSFRKALVYFYKRFNGLPAKVYDFPNQYNKNSDIAKLIKLPNVAIGIDEINHFYGQLNEGNVKITTKDEEFYNYINQEH